MVQNSRSNSAQHIDVVKKEKQAFNMYKKRDSKEQKRDHNALNTPFRMLCNTDHLVS